MLLEKIKKLIDECHNLKAHYEPPQFVNCVPCRVFRLSDRVEIKNPCNGCDSYDVQVDGVSVGRVDCDDVDPVIAEIEGRNKVEKIDSL